MDKPACGLALRIALAVLLLSSKVYADCGNPGMYTSVPWGFSTNSFWVSGKQGAILFDTQFLPSATKAMVAQIETCTGKPPLAALVLHANPDKFNGTQWLRSQGVEVLSSQQVVDVIPEVDALRRRWLEKRYAPDYPDKLVMPAVFGDASRLFQRGDIALNIYVLGASVSAAHVVADWRGHIFAGDLVANGHHAWLEKGNIDEWIADLKFLQGLRPVKIYPGRGQPGGAELLQQQIDYLQFVRAAVLRRKPHAEIDDATLAQLYAEITQHYSGYQNEYFLQLGLPALWSRLARLKSQ